MPLILYELMGQNGGEINKVQENGVWHRAEKYMQEMREYKSAC